MSEPPLERLSAQGAALLSADRAHDAVEVLRHAVAAGERDAPELLVRAYFATRSWRACVTWLAPQVEQGHVRFAGALGVALIELGERARAEDVLRLAVASGDVDAANDLGILLRDEGRPGEAVQVLERAAEAGNGEAAANLVAVLLESGELPAAVEAAERFADEARPDTLVALADVRAELGRHDDADACYRRAIELRAVRGHTAYGAFLQARGDASAAEREYLQAALHDEPGWAATMGRFLYDAGRGDEAREYLERAADEGDEESRELLYELDGVDEDDH
jgi:TPR repeat protein